MAEISIVKALQQFFSAEPHGRKLEIAELKALTEKDREELRLMLIEQGYDVAPIIKKQAA